MVPKYLSRSRQASWTGHKSSSNIYGLVDLLLVFQSMLPCGKSARRNTIQLLGLCNYAVCLCIYAALQTQVIQLTIEALEIMQYIMPGSYLWLSIRSLALANAVITGVYALAISLINFKLYAEFPWLMFRLLKGDIAMQRRYLL